MQVDVGVVAGHAPAQEPVLGHGVEQRLQRVGGGQHGLGETGRRVRLEALPRGLEAVGLVVAHDGPAGGIAQQDVDGAGQVAVQRAAGDRGPPQSWRERTEGVVRGQVRLHEVGDVGEGARGGRTPGVAGSSLGGLVASGER